MRRGIVVGVVVGTMALTLCALSAACNNADYHIVQKGDCLWKIARMHGVTVQSLCRVNGLSERSILHPGDRLIIPRKSPSAPTRHALTLQPGVKVAVRATDVNVRCRPSTSSRRLGMVDRGYVGTVIEIHGQWVKASFHTKGITGWVRVDFVNVCNQPSERIAKGTTSAKAANCKSHSRKGELLAAMAQRYIGIPYRHASNYPSRGFDCSGFVYYLLLRLGVTAPRTASGMFKIGKPVGRTELRPGDLVFFRTTSRERVTHVGIYIGDGKFVHASSGAGRVTISPLTHGYYASRYAGARRIIE